MKITNLFLLFFLFGSLSSIQVRGHPPWMNLQDTPSQRAQQLVQKMTLQEKLSMVHGQKGPYVGNVPGNQRLNIPPLNLEDGPQGVSDQVKLVTCWPSALTVVASFNVDIMQAYATALGREERLKGTNVMLAPMVNIARIPQGGRNFESFGEDPFLAAEMAAASVKGIQSNGIIATVKHWVDNNQEYHRTSVSANVDERTQHEIYYPAFKKAVEAGVGSVMCSYNRINDTYSCENYQTLTVDLKEEMQFQGFVQSDWDGTHSTVASANNGLDLEMPDNIYFGSALAQAVQQGTVSLNRLDDMVTRILTSMFAVGIFDNPQTGNLTVNVTSEEHNTLARQFAQAGTVLLKNTEVGFQKLLPLRGNISYIAVIGDAGNNTPVVAGGGSGYVIPPYLVTPYQGIANRAGSSVKVNYTASAPLQNAVQAAQRADVAILFVGTNSGEGADRPNLSLGNGQDELVSAVIASQPRTIVVVLSPGAVLMPWVQIAPAILEAFLPGQEAGNAIAGILFGDINPSGKLPITFPALESDVPANTPLQYPGVDDESSYSEQLLVGYRWYDAKNISPLFPFGHGLSYTTFEYSGLQIDGLTVSGNIRNIGEVEGTEAVQLYIGFPSSAGEPPKVLRGISTISLKPGNMSNFSFSLTSDDLSIWSIDSGKWTPVRGTFSVYVGSSSADIRLKGALVY